MPKKTKHDSENTRQLLLDAAAALFIHQGIAKTTLSDIAAQAGLTRGAVYWHFSNKEDIIRLLWERNAGELHHTFLEQLSEIRSSNHPDLAFRDAITGLMRRVANQPAAGLAIRIMMHCVEFTGEQADLRRFLRSRRNELQGAIHRALMYLEQQHLLRAQLSLKLQAQCLMSYLFGLVHQHLEPGHHPLHLARDGEAMLELLLDSILPVEPSQHPDSTGR